MVYNYLPEEETLIARGSPSPAKMDTLQKQ